MATFNKYDPISEKELHGIIEKELDSLEDGLELLKYEMSINKSIPDFLCRDSGGRIVIIEVKLNKDENILFQSLRYYVDVDANKYTIAEIFHNKSIDTKQDPRIILISKKFPENIRLLGTLIVPEIELYEYSTLKDSNGTIGIVYHPVSLPKFDNIISSHTEFEDHKKYITDAALHSIFESAREKLKSLQGDIEEYVTQSYIGYKFRGRQIGWISAQRRSFDVGAIIISDKRETLEYESIRVTPANEDISGILAKIDASYQNLAQ